LLRKQSVIFFINLFLGIIATAYFIIVEYFNTFVPRAMPKARRDFRATFILSVNFAHTISPRKKVIKIPRVNDFLRLGNGQKEH